MRRFDETEINLANNIRSELNNFKASLSREIDTKILKATNKTNLGVLTVSNNLLGLVKELHLSKFPDTQSKAQASQDFSCLEKKYNLNEISNLLSNSGSLYPSHEGAVESSMHDD
jgi:hypothetical protein